METPISIEIIWDRDHGTENEGFYARRRYADGREEDAHPGQGDATDRDEPEYALRAMFIYPDEYDVPITIIR